VDPELAEQAEMHVHDVSVIPSIEEVFSPGIDLLDDMAIEQRSTVVESTLRARNGEFGTDEPTSLKSRGAVDGVSLWHRRNDARSRVLSGLDHQSW
jgi:hypothetical protein